MTQRDLLDAVIKLLNKAAKKHPGLALKVLESGLKKDGEWLYVPIIASGTVPSSGILYDLYANAEIESEEKLNTRIMFVPTFDEPKKSGSVAKGVSSKRSKPSNKPKQVKLPRKRRG